MSKTSKKLVETLLTQQRTTPTVEDVLCRETCETLGEFEARKILTTKLLSLPEYKINPMSAVVIASMMIKKAKFGLVYDDNVEQTITFLTEQL